MALPTLILGHGASGNAASMQPYVDGLRKRGIEARALDLPKRLAEDVVPIWIAGAPFGSRFAVGGQSFGGRVASLAAAEPGSDYQAIVLYSYPLHPPGQPAKALQRSAHFAAIRCPVLFLSGEADPFARIELLRKAVEQLADAELVMYPRLGHTLKPVFEDALDRTAAFLQRVATTSISTR
jgi:predicted alpha/beta-hydrolase family hydrolase